MSLFGRIAVTCDGLLVPKLGNFILLMFSLYYWSFDCDLSNLTESISNYCSLLSLMALLRAEASSICSSLTEFGDFDLSKECGEMLRAT